VPYMIYSNYCHFPISLTMILYAIQRCESHHLLGKKENQAWVYRVVLVLI
jgi:hypothetical protein